MIVRSEESKRAVTYRVLHDGHEVVLTLAASCQAKGSAEAVAALFSLVRETLEKEWAR